MSSKRRIVIALGGNAISSGDGSADIATQFAQSRITARYIADLLCAGRQIIVTHGNGPQVGSILRRVELSRHEVYPIDLGICVADSQASMGYMISQCIRNEMERREVPCSSCTIVTTVVVDPKDPAFMNPTKPIGQFYDKEVIQERIAREGWQVVEVPGRGFRRVVPSPKPRKIKELSLIRELFEAGKLVVCCGGGGIPVIPWRDRAEEGVEAVIDKDLTSALLAAGLEVDLLAILTGVDQVCINFGKPDEERLDHLSVSAAQAYLKAGQFPAGSMGPKVQACINFLKASKYPKAEALITSPERILDALEGKSGTYFHRD